MTTPTPRRSMGTPTASLVPTQATVTPALTPSTNRYLPAEPATTSAVLVAAQPTALWDQTLQVPDGVSLTHLPAAEASEILQDVHATSLHALSLKDITVLGSGPEKELNASLGVFLDRIDKADMPQLFKLVTDLDREVKAENLDDVVAKIMDTTPDFTTRMIGMLRPGKIKEAQAQALEKVQLILSGKSQKLSAVMKQKEAEAAAESKKALEEIDALEAQKLNYRAHFAKMMGAVVYLSTLVVKAQDEVALIKHQTDAGTYQGAMPLQEAEDKLEALQSRALAVEGLFTKLPGDQMLTKQIQTVLAQTVQESPTTVLSNFIDIKGILLQLHGGMRAQALQRGMQANRDLSANLAATRAKLTNQVAHVAGNAAGDNRLHQAQQVKLLTDNIAQLMEIKDKAKTENQRKFAEARTILSTARTELTKQGAVIRPDLSVTR